MSGFFYNTNGFAFHRLDDAVTILADLGYDGIALTPDVHHLNPVAASAEGRQRVVRFRRQIEARGLGVVVETGARFVLDARRKHWPSLLDEGPDASRRLAFLETCVDLAADLGAPVVSVWAGVLPNGVTREDGWARLVGGLRALCASAERRGVRIGFEPEPGMLVQRTEEWPEIRDRVGHPALGLTLDVGHCLATREGPPENAIRAHADDLLVLHLDDHRPGVHEHLAFGEGEVDFGAVARAVTEAGFTGPLEVELSRHAATAPDTALRALAFLRSRFAA